MTMVMNLDYLEHFFGFFISLSLQILILSNTHYYHGENDYHRSLWANWNRANA